MSRNAAKPARKTAKQIDRRARRTRDVLGDALVGLMHEKPFPDITVQQVLDRAGVSRSTFYTHYRDKNDLFLSDVEEFLDHMVFRLSREGEVSNRVAAVRELFAHVAEWHRFHAVLVKAGKVRDFLELGQGYFARGIEQRLVELENGPTLNSATSSRSPALSPAGRGISRGSPTTVGSRPAVQHLRMQRTAMAQMFAGALLSLLTWWITSGTPGTPAELDELYHRMVWSGIHDSR